MYKDKKYSVYLTDEEDEILHELVTARALVGEKAYYSALFAVGIRMLHEDTCIDNSMSLKNVRVVESNSSDEEN